MSDSSAAARRGPIVTWLAVVLATLNAAAMILQPIAIGGYLNGNPSGLGTHEVNATIIDILSLVTVIAVGIAAVRNRWGTRPIVPAVILFVLVVVQTVFGYQLQMVIHIPLGVAVVGGAVMVAVMLWRLALGRDRPGVRVSDIGSVKPAEPAEPAERES